LTRADKARFALRRFLGAFQHVAESVM
jgi:hypothetical protein